MHLTDLYTTLSATNAKISNNGLLFSLLTILGGFVSYEVCNAPFSSGKSGLVVYSRVICNSYLANFSQSKSYQVMPSEWQHKIEVVIEAVSEEDVLDGGAGALVGLHEGYLASWQAVAVASEGAIVDSWVPGTNAVN